MKNALKHNLSKIKFTIIIFFTRYYKNLFKYFNQKVKKKKMSE